MLRFLRFHLFSTFPSSITPFLPLYTLLPFFPPFFCFFALSFVCSFLSSSLPPLLSYFLLFISFPFLLSSSHHQALRPQREDRRQRGWDQQGWTQRPRKHGLQLELPADYQLLAADAYRTCPHQLSAVCRPLTWKLTEK